MSSTPSSSVRAGIIGAGFMATTHARAIRAAGGTVVAAAGSSAARAHAAQTATKAQDAALSVEALVARDDIDVVHVCTPNATHERFAIAALEAGHAVVCEKPLSTSSASAADIVNAADGAGQRGTVPFVYRFHPMVREMRAQIARGDLGMISVIHGSYLQDWLADPVADNWRVSQERGGKSRAFADIGSHWFDLLEFVLGDRISRLSAQSLTAFPIRGATAVSTEDAMSVHFATERGAIGSMVASQIAAGRKNHLHVEVSGSLSSLAFDQEEPETLWRGTASGGERLARGADQLSEDAARLSFLPSGHPQGYQDAFNAFVADSYDLFTGKADDSISASLPQLIDGFRAAQICDAALTSAGTHSAWIDVPLTADLRPSPRSIDKESRP